MGSSFVSVGEHGFWLRDGLLELWLRLASLHIEDPVQSGSAATQIRDQWLLASRGCFNGCVPISLGDDVATEEGKKLVIDAIKSLQQSLADAPSDLNGDVLNLLGIEGKFGGNVETLRLIEVTQAVIDLVEGRLTSTAKDSSFMPGYR